MKKLSAYWHRMSTKWKMYTIISVVGCMMLIAILINVRVVYIFVDNEKIHMDDNMESYRFQEALSEEISSFVTVARNRTSDNIALFEEACVQTEKRLDELPAVNENITEIRYGIVWNIRNSYEVYKNQREAFMSISFEDENYISELYKTYRMQEYLESYASRLVKEVMDQNTAYYEEQIQLIKCMPYIIFLISFIAVVISFYVAKMMTKGTIRVLSELANDSKEIEKNNFSLPDVLCEEQDEMGQLVYAFNKMKHAMEAYVVTLTEKHEMEEKIYRQELEKTNLEQKIYFAQFQLLKSQLNPHFLFNTLNMITRMASMEEAPVTEEMLIAMSNLLRYNLRTTEPFAPLYQELKVLKDYMYIQKKRFGERITWNIFCELEENQVEIPVFLIQPLVENSIIHGISKKEEGGNIDIRIFRENEILQIIVKDTGEGMTQEKLSQIREAITGKGRGLGIGIGNIYRRIRAYYHHSEVTVDSELGYGTTVRISFGFRKQEE